MIRERQRGLLDFLATALCLWAAAYFTPAGALVRQGWHWARGSRGDAKPLIAYYSGGVYESAAPVPSPVEPVTPVPVLAAGTPVGKGAFAVLSALPASERTTAGALAAAVGLPAPPLDDARAGPEALAALVSRAALELGSEEAAVLALFVGPDAARFAARRAVVPTLDGMAAVLPPSSVPRAALAGRALSLSTAFALTWPVPESTRISSPFGYREHPMLGRQQLHTGVDLAVAEGTPVHVTEDGVVRRASEDPVNGRVVIVDHGHGVTTAYCHNVRLLVAVGETVRAGQIISESGTTGRSTGPHLHYQLELGRHPTDPVPFRPGQAAVVAAPAPAPAPKVSAPPGPSDALRQAFEHAGAPEPSATELE